MMIAGSTLLAMQDHAKRDFPKESCGLIVNGAYVPMFNYAPDPLMHFRIAGEQWVKYSKDGFKIDAVVHSHPNGPAYPNADDMQSQVQTNVPWVIIVTDGEKCLKPVIWGGDVPAILGREFVHGVTDCYSLIRDTFALGRDELAKQDISWPFPPIKILEHPRDDCWWAKEEGGDDLYLKGFEKTGFKKVRSDEVKPGDVFFAKIRSKQFNHGGLLNTPDLILHHLPGRLSRREPCGLWARMADLWVRYEGPK